MKKFSKIIALTVVAVMLVAMLTGCALFGKNTAKYRALPVITVGNEEITLGRVIDLFNTYYSNYYQYIEYGYYTYEDILDMTLDAIYSTYMKVDAYKTDASNVNYTAAENSYVGVYQDAEYLSQTEMEGIYCQYTYLARNVENSSDKGKLHIRNLNLDKERVLKNK